MADTIQLRRDTAANWVTANPVLADGEIGIETDTRKRKCGNGTTAWNSLPYMFSDDLDQEPTANSHKPVESSGIKAAINVAISNNGKGAFDISAYKAVGGVLAKFDDLAQALGTNGANVPAAARKPGMSVCFVLNSDNNKYVQYRLMSDTFNTTVANWQGVDVEPITGSRNLVESGGVSKNLSNRQFTNTTLLNKFIKEIYIPEFSSVSIKVNNVYKQYYGSTSTPRTTIAFILNGTQYIVFDSYRTIDVIKQFFNEPICFLVNDILVYMLVDWDSIDDGTHFVADENEGILNNNTGSINACPTIREHIKRLQPENYEIGTSIQLSAIVNGPNQYRMNNGWRTRFVPVKEGDTISLFAKDYTAPIRLVDKMDIYANMSVSTQLYFCLNSSLSFLIENDGYMALSYYVTGGDYYKLYKNGKDITSEAYNDSNHVIYNNINVFKYSNNDIFNTYIKSLKLNRYILEQQFNLPKGTNILINATFIYGSFFKRDDETIWFNRLAITINGAYIFEQQNTYATKEAALAEPIVSATNYYGQITVDTSAALNNINSFLSISLNDSCFDDYSDYIINNDKSVPFIIQQSSFTLKNNNLSELIYLPKDVKGVTRLHISGNTNPQRTYFKVILITGPNQNLRRLELFASNNTDIDLRDCYIDLFIDSDNYNFPLKIALYADVSENCPINVELISKVPYYSNIENSGLIPSSSDILIGKNRVFIKKQDIWCGHALEVEKDKRYSMYIKTSRTWNGTLRLLVADSKGNHRTALGYDIPGNILNSGYRFEFTASFTQQILMFYFMGDDNISDNPYIDYELYGTESNYVKTSKEAIKSIITDINPNVLTSNIKELNLIKEISKGYMEFDACIVGAGSAGLNAAAALIRNGYSVCIVDRNDNIGGTLANAWVNCCAATPDTPFFREIAKELIFAGKAAYVDTFYQPIKDNQLSVDYLRSLIRTQFRHDNQEEVCITFDVDSYINKMTSKLIGVCFMTGYEFVSAVSNNGEVSSITISDKNGDNHIIHSRIFIDSSADGVLCRYVNSTEDTDFFVGSDATNTYQSIWGFTEAHASGKNRNSLNNPTLMFRTKQFSEEKIDLDPIDISGLNYYLNPYYYGDGSKKYSYCNSSAFLTVGSGADLVAPGTTVKDAANTIIVNTTPKILPYWKYTKTYGISGSPGGTTPNTYIGQGVVHQAFDSIAKMLGIRETYRIACERMLNENDLYVIINPSNLNVQNNLDSPIAIGNHPVDLHGADAGTTNAINENRKPYFVKYGTIIPKNLKNVFIACRGAGLTHIGAATFRLNKDMMQLGWMAGNAATQFLRDNLSDIRSVDTADLQNDSGFVELCNEVYNIIS